MPTILNKERARRGYWQRKFIRLAHQHSLQQTENETLIANNTALHLSCSYFYELGKMNGCEDTMMRHKPLIEQLQQTCKERLNQILELNANLKKLTTSYDKINCSLQKILREALFCVKECVEPITIKKVKILPESTIIKKEVDEILELINDIQVPNQVKRKKRKKRKTKVKTPQIT